MATDSVSKVADTQSKIDNIITSIHSMNDKAQNIATAGEELYNKAGEVSFNVSGISFLANETSEGAQEAVESNKTLTDEIEMSQRLINQFKLAKA